MLTLGIDCGTSSTKTVVLEVESGVILREARRTHSLVSGLPRGSMEQNPGEWISAAAETIEECLEAIGPRRDEVRALGVSGQQHGLVVLDHDDSPIRPAKLWCDTSTVRESNDLNQAFGGKEQLIALTGNAMTPGFTAPKLLWMKRNEPENFRKIRSVLLPHDYLNFWLTGNKQMEYGDASGTGWMDIRNREWCRPVLDFIDPGVCEHLPPLRSSCAPVGQLANSLRDKWGLRDVLVSAGGGDNMMGAIGTGNIGAGTVTMSLGSSGTIYSSTPRPIVDGRGEIAAFCDSTDQWLPLACTMNVAGPIHCVRSLFGWDVPAMEGHVAAVPAGAGGLSFLPYLMGERTPNLPEASGAFHGLRAETMTAPFLARAVLEGVMLGLAYALKRCVEVGVAPSEIRMTGGGSKSPTWRQMAADVFGLPVVALEASEGAALGAALQAAWQYAKTQDRDASLSTFVEKCVRVDEQSRGEPRPAEHMTYQKMLLRQEELTQKLGGV